MKDEDFRLDVLDMASCLCKDESTSFFKGKVSLDFEIYNLKNLITISRERQDEMETKVIKY